MNYKAVRQRIIQHEIDKLTKEKDDGKSDEGLSSYGSTQRFNDIELINELKQKIKRQVNHHQYSLIFEQLAEEQYLLDQIIATEKHQINQLDHFHSQLLSQSQPQKPKTNPKYINIDNWCQTKSITEEDQGCQCKPEQSNKTMKKEPTLFQNHAYSMCIYQKEIDQNLTQNKQPEKDQLWKAYQNVEKEVKFLNCLSGGSLNRKKQKKRMKEIISQFWAKAEQC